MKYLLLISLLSIQLAHSQYSPFLTPNKHWLINGFNYEMSDPCSTIMDIAISSEMVECNLILYNKVETISSTGCDLFGSILLREDIDAKKVFICRYSEPNEETLLFDFSLGIGDFIPIDGFDVGWLYEGTIISDITYENVFGFSNVKTFHLKQLFEGQVYNVDFKIYEGIGTSDGLNLISKSEHIFYLFNYFVLSNDNYLSEEKNIDVFPNPFDESIHIKTTENIKSTSLYDTLGKMLFQCNSVAEMEQKSKELKSGIYILKFQTQNDVINTIKVLKK